MIFSSHTLVLQVLFSFLPLTILADRKCSTSYISRPALPGAEIQRVTAKYIQNFTGTVFQSSNAVSREAVGLELCNVTVTYTHPGQKDTVNVWVLLPTLWSGRFQGAGGGGWSAGFTSFLTAAAADGYAGAATDGGHDSIDPAPAKWAQVSPGNVNWYLLNDFASVSLNDMTIIGKQITESYYRKPISFSYWNGCSQGGRQGLMQAQRFPNNYDGILANAPAVNWAQSITALYWPYSLMNKIGYFPSQCELEAVTAAVIKACDGLDGVHDGIVSQHDLCNFKAGSVVGQKYTCKDKSTVTITEGASKIAEAVWSGISSASGKSLWYGLEKSTALSVLAATTCISGNGGNCTGIEPAIAAEWISLFVTPTTPLDAKSLTFEGFEKIFRKSIDLYNSTIGTSNPDLSEFKASGGKMITWHGLVDQLLGTSGTAEYYSRVEAQDPQVRDYYRLFLAPGVEHCGTGPGAFPGTALAQLVKWVEEGVAPQTLHTQGRTLNGTATNLEVCPWPLVSVYRAGDPTVARSYTCVKV